MSVARVIVVGAGTMGTAIADTFARAGLPTALMSRDPSRLTGLHDNIQAVSGFPEASPELIIEAIPEDIDLKVDLFRNAQATYGGKPIVASNSSGLPLQDIADRLGFPDRFLGIHYFHPARELPLVEVVRVAETSDDALADARRLLSMSGRDSVVMHRPMPGALINRLQHAMLHEAYHLMSQGLASAEDIDKAARWLLGPRMCISGLLEQKDIGGLEGHACAQQAIVPDLCHDTRPSFLVQDMLARGDIGLKSGKGFYDWRGQDAHAVAERASA
ncbi:MAG TPA: 3-hydroxyacyl-CoA dehydrogenase NAD-binding domain-containing protein, partial [Modicisalibacter sp.]|nr:3-hydroxyacyl-CoA dehydrogenase NAD-binding domain-containing protein [Modicisalibacter sp.]